MSEPARRPRARGGGRGLPLRVAARPRHADPPARRLRPAPRRRCTRPSRRRSSSGRATACRPIRAPGWSRPAASRRSTRMRRRARFDASLGGAGRRGSRPRRATPTPGDDEDVEDDRLRLIFTCCHPALAPDAQVALTLREVCGLTTEEIARAFLTRAADAGPAHRARQGEDPRRAHSLRGAGAAPSCRSGSTPCCT